MNRIIFITDIHGATADLDRLPDADLCLIGGDISHFGSPEDVTRVLDCIGRRYASVYAVLGNCDPPEAEMALENRNIRIDLHPRESHGCVLLGVGGSNTTPANTLYEWDDDLMGNVLSSTSVGTNSEEPVILVTHAPPFGSGADQLPSGIYVGSRAVADFIARIRPSLVFCGHIHEAVGVFAQEGIPVVNPGQFRQGHYATACWDSEKRNWKIALSQC